MLTFRDSLTTYNEVMRSYPNSKPPKECRTAVEREQWWEETYEKERGFFHRIHFLRIVLDEAQAIKNYQSRTSIAWQVLPALFVIFCPQN